MNGDYLLAERLIEVFRREANHINATAASERSYNRIADSIQQLLDEHNPPKKETERDL